MTLIRTFVSSHIWIGFCAAGSYLYAACLISQITFDPLLFTLIACATTVLYNFLGLLKKPIKAHNKLVLFICTGISLWTFALLGLTTEFVLFLPALVIGVLYGYTPGLKKGMRSLPMVKIFLIALVWVYVTSALPLLVLHYEEVLTQHLLLLFSQFLFLIAVTIPFDIRDLPFDDKGMQTIPQIFGERKAVYLSLALLLFSAIILVVYCNAKEINPISLLLIYGISGVVIAKSNVSRSKLYFTGLIDGLLFLQGVIAWMFSDSLY